MYFGEDDVASAASARRRRIESCTARHACYDVRSFVGKRRPRLHSSCRGVVPPYSPSRLYPIGSVPHKKKHVPSR